VNMKNEAIYHWAGASGLLSIVLFGSEIPLCLARGPFPTWLAPSLIAYVTRNASNMITLAIVDFLACTFLLLFLTGFRRLIGEAQPRLMWVATQVFGVGVAFCGFRLFTDLLQGSIAVNAFSGDPDPSLVRAFLSDPFPPLGIMGLVFAAVSLSAASYISRASGALPRSTVWLGYLSALLCLALIPFVLGVGPNTAQLIDSGNWAATGAMAAGAPLALWVLAAGVAMFRQYNLQSSRSL
jgi:hypothetical protein